MKINGMFFGRDFVQEGGGLLALARRQLKHVVAELTLDNRALKAVLAKKW